MIKVGKDGSRSLPYIPKELSPGLRLVHNFVPDQDQRALVGLHGFRIWVQNHAKHVKVCRCGFAPHIRRHYMPLWRSQAIKAGT